MTMEDLDLPPTDADLPPTEMEPVDAERVASVAAPELTEAELDAVHLVEVGTEWLHRAHGSLVSFHHKTGRAMDHLAAAEELFRQAGRDDLADRLRDELLPRGVVPREEGPGRWTYEVLEVYEAGLYADAREFEVAVREAMTDGVRHAAERRQQAAWRSRACRQSSEEERVEEE